MKITDELLYRHAAEARDIWLETLPADGEFAEHQFSEDFRLRLEQAAQQSRKRSRPFRGVGRAAAVWLLLLAGAGAWLGMDAGAGAAFARWARESTAASAVGRWFGQAAEGPVADYRLSWLPDGLQAAESANTGTAGSVVYESETGDFCVLSFSLPGEEASFQPPPDEEALRASVEINGITGDCYEFYESPDRDCACLVVWSDDGVSFRLSSSLTKAETIRMAESVSGVPAESSASSAGTPPV